MMNNMESYTATFLSMIVPLAAGFLLRDVEIVGTIFSRNRTRIQELARKEDEIKLQEKSLSSKEESLVAKEAALSQRENELVAREARALEEMKTRDAALIQKETQLSEQFEKRVEDLSRKEEARVGREKELDGRESTLLKREEKLRDLELREAALIEREAALQEDIEKKESARIAAVVDQEPEVSANEGPADGGEVVGGGEKEKRIQMIKDELQKIVQQAEQEELDGEEMEKEAVEALEKAALVVAYRKKYYDVIKDELFYFPSVSKTIISYALMEEAEKYYYEEDDEFPLDYSAALRSIVTANLGDDEDDDIDEDYMAKLALDVDI